MYDMHAAPPQSSELMMVLDAGWVPGCVVAPDGGGRVSHSSSLILCRRGSRNVSSRVMRHCQFSARLSWVRKIITNDTLDLSVRYKYR
jgi:hypothetical protein